MISEAEKEILIKQIEIHLGERPLFYLKFCEEVSWANDVAAGNLYGNTAECFRIIENKTGECGQGDKQDLINIIETQRVIMMDPDTGTPVLIATSGTLNIKYSSDKKIPIVSFVGISLRDMVLEDFNEKRANFRFPFTDDEFKSMKLKFGNYCTILGAREIEARIENYCKEIGGADYIFDKVVYCPQNTFQRIEAFNNGDKQRYLYKNECFSYQREYRLAIAIEMPNDHFIRLGKIESAKVFNSDVISNFRFSIEYKMFPKEEA